MQASFIAITLISLIAGTFIGFKLVLTFLKVAHKINQRSLVLTGLFIGVQLIVGLIAGLLNIQLFFSYLITLIVFGYILRKFLILKTWQVIAIPVFVSFLSGVITAFPLILFFKNVSN